MQRGCVDTLQSCRRGEEDGKSTVTFGRFFIVPRPKGPLAGQGNCSSWGSSTVSRGTIIFRHRASHWLEVRSKNTLILLSAFSQIQTICFIPWIYPAAWGQGALLVMEMSSEASRARSTGRRRATWRAGRCAGQRVPVSFTWPRLF